jgi:hypothetical protein
VLGAVRDVLVALPALRADHGLLRDEPRLVERGREVAHSIGLEPQRERELMRGNDLVVRGAIDARRGVRIARPGALQHFIVMAAEPLGRALEQVLEQVREPCTIGTLVTAADAVPDADADLRRRVVLVDHDLEPARQRAAPGQEVRQSVHEPDRLGHSASPSGPVRCSESASW